MRTWLVLRNRKSGYASAIVGHPSGFAVLSWVEVRRFQSAEQILHLAQQVARGGSVLNLHGFAKLANQLALCFRELLRRLHDNLHYQVSGVLSHLCRVAGTPAGLRAFVDPEHGISFKCRYMNLSAQRDLGKGNEDDAMKIIAIALEERVWLYG